MYEDRRVRPRPSAGSATRAWIAAHPQVAVANSGRRQSPGGSAGTDARHRPSRAHLRRRWPSRSTGTRPRRRAARRHRRSRPGWRRQLDQALRHRGLVGTASERPACSWPISRTAAPSGYQSRLDLAGQVERRRRASHQCAATRSAAASGPRAHAAPARDRRPATSGNPAEWRPSPGPSDSSPTSCRPRPRRAARDGASRRARSDGSRSGFSSCRQPAQPARLGVVIDLPRRRAVAHNVDGTAVVVDRPMTAIERPTLSPVL